MFICIFLFLTCASYTNVRPDMHQIWHAHFIRWALSIIIRPCGPLCYKALDIFIFFRAIIVFAPKISYYVLSLLLLSKIKSSTKILEVLEQQGSFFDPRPLFLFLVWCYFSFTSHDRIDRKFKQSTSSRNVFVSIIIATKKLEQAYRTYMYWKK